MKKEKKELFEKRFIEYCKFDKYPNKNRFEAIFNSWNESENFLLVDFTMFVTTNELEYFRSLGWELISSYSYGIIFTMNSCIFKKSLNIGVFGVATQNNNFAVR